jgi:hypothetical protein
MAVMRLMGCSWPMEVSRRGARHVGLAALGAVGLCACGPSPRGYPAVGPSPHVPTAQEIELATEIRMAKDELEHDLYDASSVPYRNVVLVTAFHLDRSGDSPAKDVHAFCGEMNAKNQFGAYAGFRRFSVLASTSPSPVPGPADIENPEWGGPVGWLAFCKGETGTPVQF